MTVCFPIISFEDEPYRKIFSMDEKVQVSLDWITHGNFGLRVGEASLNLEADHADLILRAFESCEKPSGRKPFWTGTIPRRGWGFCDYLLEVYACDEKFIKLITSSCTDVIGPTVPCYHTQMLISVEAMRTVRDTIRRELTKKEESNVNEVV